MAKVTEFGIEPRDLTGYVELFRALYREAFGEDLALDDETVAGQLIGIQAAPMAINDEALVSLANALSPRRATKRHLDDLADLLLIDRRGATRSTVTLSLGGVAGTTVPAGSRARTAAGDRFETSADAVLADSAVSVTAQAADSGPVTAAAGEINRIVTAVAGWETVTNPVAAEIGRAEESDADFRARFAAQVLARSASPAAAIRAALIEAGAGEKTVVLENDGPDVDTRQNFPLMPHSILVIADGGQPADLDAAIRATKSAGCGIVGAIRGGGYSLSQLASESNFTWLGTADSITWGVGTNTGAEYAADLTTAIQAGSGIPATLQGAVVGFEPASGFVLSYPIYPDVDVTLPTQGVATRTGLAAGELPPGLFLRPEKRDLSVTATVRVVDGFPADGLARMKRAVADEAERLGIGEKPWAQNFLRALESVPGTEVASYAVEDGSTAISGITMPLDRLYELGDGEPGITLA